MGAIQLALFESLKSYVINAPNIDFDVTTLVAEALFGAIGGSIGAAITTPFDIITTLTIKSIEDENSPYRNKNPVEIFTIVYKENGIGGIFQGGLTRTIYWAPAISIFLTVYCSTRQYAIAAL